MFMKNEKNPLVLHHFLIAIYPILLLYGANLDQDPSLWQMVGILIGIAGAVSFLMFSLLNPITKDNQKSGLITSSFFFFFYSYGIFYDSEPIRSITNSSIILSIGPDKIFLLLWAVIILTVAYSILGINRSLYFITKFLNIFSIILICISLIYIYINIPNAYLISLFYNYPDSINEDTMAMEMSDELPDIYYIILDMYASSNTLRDIYSFDNSNFEKHLREKGFFIANASLSNYGPFTMDCLACYLNMDYLNNISDMKLNEEPTFQVIQDNEVARFLKSKGYMIINIGSNWGPTAINPNADLNFYEFKLGTWQQIDFLKLCLYNTMLRPFRITYLDSDQSRVLKAFSRLEDMPSIKRPKFVLAHFLSPHQPIVFGKNGEKFPASFKNDSLLSGRQLYLNQLIFINYKLEHLIDSLIARSDVPPIIIIQSDHGPRFSYDNPDSEKCFPTNQTLLEERTTIFNAYYMPNIKNVNLYDSITPVNSFRLVFNSFFGTNYRLLDDRSYYFCGELGENIDVTDKLT
jgi:hypothetical protein